MTPWLTLRVRPALLALLGSRMVMPHPAFANHGNPIERQNTSQQVYHIHDREEQHLQDLLASAQSHLNQHDYASAAGEFQQYLAERPDSAAIHFQLGYAFTALKQPTDAAREYGKAAELDPKMAAAQLNLGLTLLERDPAGAVAPLRQATALMPNEARPEFLLGWAQERSGHSAEAIENYRAAEKLDARDFDIYLALARTLLAAKQIPDAQTQFQEALAIIPDSAAAHLGLAQCLIALAKPADAVTELREYLKIVPGDAETRLQLAQVFQDQGNMAQALGELQLVSGTLGAPAKKMEAEIYEQQKDTIRATAALAQVIAAAPRDAEAHAELGRLYFRAKNYPAAAKELAAAYQLDSRDDTLLKDLASAHYLGGDFPGALKVLAMVEQSRPLMVNEWYLRALCNDKLDLVPDAYAAFEKFLELNKGAENDEYFVASARARVLQSELKNKKK